MKKTYAYHKPGQGGLDKIAELRQAFSDFDELICTLVPECRERSVALTHLETVSMWANKGIVINDPESTIQK